MTRTARTTAVPAAQADTTAHQPAAKPVTLPNASASKPDTMRKASANLVTQTANGISSTIGSVLGGTELLNNFIGKHLEMQRANTQADLLIFRETIRDQTKKRLAEAKEEHAATLKANPNLQKHIDEHGAKVDALFDDLFN